MNKTKIEYVDYTWNPITGCKRGCSFCYARKIHNRFYPDIPFEELQWHDERLNQPKKVRKSSRILVGSMSDLEFWRHVDMLRIIEIAEVCPQHTFLFLTKNAQVYDRYSFPQNCWLGQTVIEEEDYNEISNGNLTFISFEPLLNNDIGKYGFPADWYIIGGLTPKPSDFITMEGIDKIVRQASYFDVPVFMKENVGPAWLGRLIQEFPDQKESEVYDEV